MGHGRDGWIAVWIEEDECNGDHCSVVCINYRGHSPSSSIKAFVGFEFYGCPLPAIPIFGSTRFAPTHDTHPRPT
jgi:hypothetical protein